MHFAGRRRAQEFRDDGSLIVRQMARCSPFCCFIKFEKTQRSRGSSMNMNLLATIPEPELQLKGLLRLIFFFFSLVDAVNNASRSFTFDEKPSFQ